MATMLWWNRKRENERALDLLIYYNTRILKLVFDLQHEVWLLQPKINFFGSENETIEINSENISRIESIIAELLKEVRVLLSFKKFEESNNALFSVTLRNSLESIIADVHQLKKIAEEPNNVDQDHSEYKNIHSILWNKLINLIKELEGALYKEKNIKRLINEMDQEFFIFWQRNIKDKTGWLYHGTSILFLESIKNHGLDSKYCYAGIKRALEHIYSVSRKYSVDLGPVGIDNAEREVSLTSSIDVVKAARAPDLPAFMYESLNEEYLTEESRAGLVNLLNDDERFMIKAIWRFGRILRRRNKRVILYIKVDSTFLRFYRIPDFIRNYEAFFSIFAHNTVYYFYNHREWEAHEGKEKPDFVNLLRGILGETIGRLALRAYNGGSYISGQVNIDEMNVKNVPPNFIYVNLAGKFIPVSKVSEKMLPLIVAEA